MYQACDIDGLVKVSPYAVFYVFHTFTVLLTTGVKNTPMLPQVILHVRMLFLAYFLSQLLMTDEF